MSGGGSPTRCGTFVRRTVGYANQIARAAPGRGCDDAPTAACEPPRPGRAPSALADGSAMTSVEPRSQDDDAADEHHDDDDADDRHDDAADRSDQEQGEGRSGGAKGDRGARVKNAHIIEEFINVGVANDVAFDQWTQYDDWSDIFKKE